jgi:hypothetical protein
MNIEKDKLLDSEKDIEKYLRDRVKELGGFYRKVVYQDRQGAPDDWCFFPYGKLVIVECKGRGGKVDKHQSVEHEELRKMGFSVHVVYSRFDIEKVFLIEGLISEDFAREGSDQ